MEEIFSNGAGVGGSFGVMYIVWQIAKAKWGASQHVEINLAADDECTDTKTLGTIAVIESKQTTIGTNIESLGTNVEGINVKMDEMKTTLTDNRLFLNDSINELKLEAGARHGKLDKRVSILEERTKTKGK